MNLPKPVASKFEAKRFVVSSIPSSGIRLLSSPVYIPRAGDIVWVQRNEMVTNDVLSSALHMVVSHYIGITWSDSTFSLLWKPTMIDGDSFRADLSDMYEIRTSTKRIPHIHTLIHQAYYHPVKNEFHHVPMPCKVENFGKYSGINVNALEMKVDKELAVKT